jgi:hypothetical protein
VSDGLIETYLSTVHSLWPTSPEPRLHRSRGPGLSARRDASGFLVLPHPGSPRMLVPLGNPAAASQAMQRFSAGLSPAEIVKRLSVSAALRARSGFAFPHRIEVLDGPGSLRDWLADVLGEPVEFSIALGTARANRKPVLQVFDRRGRSIAFAKVGATPLAETHVAAEVEALTVLERRGAPLGLEVPRIIRAERWQGMLVLVMTALPTSVWQRPSRQWELPCREMDALHARFAGEAAPLRLLPVWESICRARDELADVVSRDRFAAAVHALGERAGDRPFVPGAWHGDWTPWNMGRRRGLLQLWDWERFELGAPPGLDRCHYGVNAVCRRDGVSLPSVLEGLRLAGIDLASRDGRDRLLAGVYLAAITGRYLAGAETDLGDTVRDRALVMLDALCHVLDGSPA